MKKSLWLMLLMLVFGALVWAQDPTIKLPTGLDNLVLGILDVNGAGYWAPGRFSAGIDGGTKALNKVTFINNNGIYLVDLQTGAARYIDNGQDPWISSNGDSIVYIKNYRLYIYSMGKIKKISDLYASRPCWRNNLISFISTGTSESAGVGNGPNQVWIIKPDGTGARMIYKGPSIDSYIAERPQINFDGKSVIVDGQKKIDLQTGRITKITLSSGPAFGLFILLKDQKGSFILYGGPDRKFFKKYI